MNTPLSEKLIPFGTTIFSEMTRLAQAHGAINLAQGFPDFDGPPEIVEAAVAALRQGENQYARSQGHPRLVQAVADRYARHYGMHFDPMTEVGVYSGCTEGLMAAMQGLLNPGDEVVLFEPYYDSYPVCVAMAGARARFCTLRAPDFAFDPAAFEAAITPRTRLVVLNTPHNPTGKVFTADELRVFAEICVRHDLLVLADEVYEHLTYAPHVHVPVATAPGLAARTLTLSSAGKTFSLTGWKVGWGVGPAPLVAAAQAAHQFMTFSTATPLQAGLAAALNALDDDFFVRLTAEYTARRDFLVRALEGVGFRVRPPRGHVLHSLRARRRLGGRRPLVRASPRHGDRGRRHPAERFLRCLGRRTAPDSLRVLQTGRDTDRRCGAPVAPAAGGGDLGMTRIAGVQMDLVWEDPQANFTRAAARIADAAAGGARLVVLPEMFATGFSMRAQPMAAHADATIHFLSAAAKRHGLDLVGGFADPCPALPRNAAAHFGPDGAEKARYHKIHPFSLAREQEHFAGGDRLFVTAVDGLRVCTVICYDLRFPEIFRAVADRTDLFVVIANWPEARREAWSTLLRARAIENQCFVLGVNRVGVGNGLAYVGDSALIGPTGDVRSAAAGCEALVGGEITADEVSDVRRRFGFLADRRPDVYARLT